ncbi:MAG TPA: hypothetical protein QGF58_23850, partial [Myxococcota bacterium]|nr:hypothetical protein [Myxococcota bacterium]
LLVQGSEQRDIEDARRWLVEEAIPAATARKRDPAKWRRLLPELAELAAGDGGVEELVRDQLRDVDGETLRRAVQTRWRHYSRARVVVLDHLDALAETEDPDRLRLARMIFDADYRIRRRSQCPE